MLRRQGDDLAADFDLAVVIGHDLDPVAGLAAIGIAGIGLFGGLRDGVLGDSQSRKAKSLDISNTVVLLLFI